VDNNMPRKVTEENRSITREKIESILEEAENDYEVAVEGKAPIDLSGLDLSKLVLSGAILNRTDLNKADLHMTLLRLS
jgi:uncharacterized protein YjbI with pentapeptide repeats